MHVCLLRQPSAGTTCAGLCCGPAAGHARAAACWLRSWHSCCAGIARLTPTPTHLAFMCALFCRAAGSSSRAIWYPLMASTMQYTLDRKLLGHRDSVLAKNMGVIKQLRRSKPSSCRHRVDKNTASCLWAGTGGAASSARCWQRVLPLPGQLLGTLLRYFVYRCGHGDAGSNKPDCQLHRQLHQHNSSTLYLSKILLFPRARPQIEPRCVHLDFGCLHRNIYAGFRCHTEWRASQRGAITAAALSCWHCG